jgi:hypothetical protein
MQIHLLSGHKGWFFLIKQKPITVRKVIIQNRCVCVSIIVSFFPFLSLSGCRCRLIIWLGSVSRFDFITFRDCFRFISLGSIFIVHSAGVHTPKLFNCMFRTQQCVLSLSLSVCLLAQRQLLYYFSDSMRRRSRWLSVNCEICSSNSLCACCGGDIIILNAELMKLGSESY